VSIWKINIIICVYIASFGLYGALKMPSASETKTNKNYRKILIEWFESITLKPYLSRHKSNPSQKKVAFLKKYCRYKANLSGAKTPKELLKESKKFSIFPKENIDPMSDFDNEIDEKVSDAVFYAITGDLLVHIDDFYNRDSFVNAIKYFNYANDNIHQQHYPDKLRIITADGIAKAEIRSNYSWWLQNTSCATIASCLGENNFKTKEDLRVLNYLFYHSLFIKNKFYYFNKIHNEIYKQKIKLAPVIKEYIQGVWLIQKSSKNEEWSDSSIKQLTNLFSKVAKTWSDIPEPWIMLMRVLHYPPHSPDKKKAIEYFEKAVNAQIDYLDAYRYYLWIADKDRNLLMDLFRATYEQSLTNPMICGEVAMAPIRIAKYTKSPYWKQIFRNPEVKEKINNAYTATLARGNLNAFEKKRYTMEYAYLNAWMGNYDKAKKLLNEIPKSFLAYQLFFFKAQCLTRWRESFENELELFTGKHKELLKKWEDANLSDDIMTAMEIADQLDKEAEKDKHLKRYLLINHFTDKLNMARYQTPFHCTWLSYFIKTHHNEMAKQLIDAGADINGIEPATKWNPLHYASDYNNYEMTKILIAKGVDINSKTNLCFTPFILAEKNKDLKMLRLLANKGADYNLVEKGKRTALICFAGSGRSSQYPEILDFLLALPKININAKNYFGQTALCVALDEQNDEVARKLIKKGADPNIVPYIGTPALHYAILQNKFDLFKSLLEHGADLNLRTTGIQQQHSATDFIIFYPQKHEKYMKLLLKYKPDLSTCDIAGDTPLHNAIYNKNMECIKLLLDAGAKKTIKNHAGQSPIDVANGEIKDLLLK